MLNIIQLLLPLETLRQIQYKIIFTEVTYRRKKNYPTKFLCKTNNQKRK